MMENKLRCQIEVDNMARTAMINARTERELKNEVEEILESLGLSTTEAINIFSVK
jgi:addiction module RelB/DinJ family antitoxin